MTTDQEQLELLEACLRQRPFAWQKLVDLLLPTALQVIDISIKSRKRDFSEQDREDLATAIFESIQADDYALLRNFDRHSSLTTYFTIVAQRVVTHSLTGSEG